MAGIDRATALATARTTLAALGLTAQDLLGEPNESVVRFGTFVATDVVPALSKGQANAWKTYVSIACGGCRASAPVSVRRVSAPFAPTRSGRRARASCEDRVTAATPT